MPNRNQRGAKPACKICNGSGRLRSATPIPDQPNAYVIMTCDCVDRKKRKNKDYHEVKYDHRMPGKADDDSDLIFEGDSDAKA